MPPQRGLLTTLALLAALASACPRAAFAQALDLDEAARLAAEGNLGLRRAARVLAAKQRAAEAAGNLLYPSAGLGASLSRSSSADLPEAKRWSASASLSVSLSLSTTIRLKAERLRSDYESGKLDYRSAERGLENQVRSAFYSILLSKGKLDLARQNAERARKRLEQVKARYEAGLAPELEYLSAQASRESLSAQAGSAQAAYDDLLASFRLLLGLEPDRPIELAGSLDRAKAVTAAAAAAAIGAAGEGGSLEREILERKLAAAEIGRALAAAAILPPALGVSARTAPTLSSWDTGGKLSDSGSVSISLSLPLDGLAPGSAARVALAEAEDAVAAVESQIEERRRSEAASAASLSRAIAAAQASLASLERSAALAQRKYELMSEAYQNGYKDLSALEDAEAALESAKMDVIAQEYSILAKALELEAALGIDFGTIGR